MKFKFGGKIKNQILATVILMKLLDSNAMILIMSDTSNNKSHKDESGGKERYNKNDDIFTECNP